MQHLEYDLIFQTCPCEPRKKNWQELLFDIRRSENVTACALDVQKILGKLFLALKKVKKVPKTWALVRWQVSTPPC